MPHAVVQDVVSSWEGYASVFKALYVPLPDGLILQVAGRTDEGFRIIAVWENEADWKRFQEERLGPVSPVGELPRRQPIVRELHVDHVVASERAWPAVAVGKPTQD